MSFRALLRAAGRRKLARPLLAQQTAELLVQCRRQRNRLACPVKRDRLPDVVNDDLARIAVDEMLLESLAEGRLLLSVHVVVQSSQKFFAFHGSDLPIWNARLMFWMRRADDRLQLHFSIHNSRSSANYNLLQ